MSGIWRVSYSIRFSLEGDRRTNAWLYHNGDQIPETWHYSGVSGGWVTTVGGREVFLQAQEGDSITLRTGGMGGNFDQIETCVEYQAV